MVKFNLICIDLHGSVAAERLNFVLASVLLTPVLVREINAWWEGQGMTTLFVLSFDGQI